MRSALAVVVATVALTAAVLGVVGLVNADTVGGMLFFGAGMIGSGLVLGRLAWRLHRGVPSAARQAAGRPRDKVRALSRELARRQWQLTAVFLLALVPVYLVLSVVADDAALGAAAVAAIGSGVLGLLAWATGPRPG